MGARTGTAGFNPFKANGIAEGLFLPIHKAIELVLPRFVKKNLRDPKVRSQIVTAADAALVQARPEARIIPAATRKRIIKKVLDIVLDDVVLS